MARLFGVMAALASVAFGLTATLQFLGESLSTPGVSASGNLLVACFCLAISLAFLIVRPYRPDLENKEVAAQNSPPKLGWWTGTPKSQ